MRPQAPSYSPAIRTTGDSLLSLPVRHYSVTALLPRRTCSVDAITEAGTRLVGAHRLGVVPERVLVVETQRRLSGTAEA